MEFGGCEVWGLTQWHMEVFGFSHLEDLRTFFFFFPIRGFSA